MDIPVLLLVYNRPKQTKTVLDRLRSCGVNRVFASVDGPKNAQDKLLTDEVRNILSQAEIVVKLNSRLDNLGCKQAVITGIDWFFDQVDEGIILEDDCLPSEHFFTFVEEMLSRYRNESKVWMISGNNPLGNWDCDGGHFFTRFGHIWGWATWKDRWKSFKADLPEFDSFTSNHGFQRASGPTDLAAYREMITHAALKGEIDTWDYQWNAHMLMQNGLAVIPKENLVQNIGFEASATTDFELPEWIGNSVSEKPISISERPVVADREYEMEWSLARRTNQRASPSHFHYENLGKTIQKPLRILSINSTDVGGGSELISFLLHQKFSELGHESLLLVETKKTQLETVQEIADWSQQVERFNPDVIHVHNLHGTSVSLEETAQTAQKFPTLFTLHDTWLITGSNNHPFEWQPTGMNVLDLREWNEELRKRKAVLANSLIRFTAPSQWMRELFVKRHQIRPFYVPNAVENLDPKADNHLSDRYILFVANKPETNPYKDFETLMNAWQKANETLQENVVDLVVVGGSSKTDTIGNRKAYFLEKQTAEEIRGLITNSILVVHPSKQDNAPLTILEAHTCGKPVIASLVGGIPELLNEQESEWLYSSGNISEFAEKLTSAVTATAFTKTPEHASVATMVNTYLGHYSELNNA